MKYEDLIGTHRVVLAEKRLSSKSKQLIACIEITSNKTVLTYEVYEDGVEIIYSSIYLNQAIETYNEIKLFTIKNNCVNMED